MGSEIDALRLKLEQTEAGGGVPQSKRPSLSSVSVSEGVSLVGARLGNGITGASGSAYVFERQNGVWTQTAKITANDGAAQDYLGTSVSVSGDTIVNGKYGTNISPYH